MRQRFRDFIRSTPFCLKEDEAAPPMGASPAPPVNPTNNDHHFDMLKNQLGMEDDDFDTAMQDQSVTIWLPQDFSKKWGFEVSGSTQANIKKREDGNWDVTFQLDDQKLMRPKSFIYPYKQGQKPTNYKGDIENKTVVMTPKELQDAMSVPFQAGTFQPPQGGMGGGMDAMGGGGMGGMGGGAPPAGMPPSPTGGAGGPGGM